MRRLVRSTITREYYSEGHWTSQPDQAQHFHDAGHAIETCLKHHLTDVELVLQVAAEPQEAFDTRVRLFDYNTPG